MKTSVFVGVSLDGFLARPDGAFDFLAVGNTEHENGYEEFIATVDALLIGRNTYEVVRKFPQWPYGATPVFVLSRRPLAAAPEGASVEWMQGEPPQLLDALAKRGFGHVYVDGGITIQGFLRAGLVDRVVITRVPVLIGSGVPLFGAVDADVALVHVATRALPSGAVQSEYRPVGAKPTAA